MSRLLALLLLASLAAGPVLTAAEPPAAPAPAVPKLQQFVYVLHLVPRLHDDKAWTEADSAVIGRHVAHLKAATERGQLILAGRTKESGNQTFGLVIFEAEDEAAARAFMESDPAVAGKIMIADLHPYAVVFRRTP